MNKSQIITGLVQTDRYQESAQIRRIVDGAVSKLREAETDIEIKTVMVNLQNRLAKALDTKTKKAKIVTKQSVEKDIKELDLEELKKLTNKLKARFDQCNDPKRHNGITWRQVMKRLKMASPEKLWSLNEMERTGGEPDVVGIDKQTGELIFQDLSPESPAGRRNCVYDKDAQETLKRNFSNQICNGNAVDMAAEMGVELLDERQYRKAQKAYKLDEDSWSWIKTPIYRRRMGDALNGGRDRDDFYIYILDGGPCNHDDNGGWRGLLRI